MKTVKKELQFTNLISFRPLIRGFFFYSEELYKLLDIDISFPSPHSGILFLY